MAFQEETMSGLASSSDKLHSFVESGNCCAVHDIFVDPVEQLKSKTSEGNMVIDVYVNECSSADTGIQSLLQVGVPMECKGPVFLTEQVQCMQDVCAYDSEKWNTYNGHNCNPFKGTNQGMLQLPSNPAFTSTRTPKSPALEGKRADRPLIAGSTVQPVHGNRNGPPPQSNKRCPSSPAAWSKPRISSLPPQEALGEISHTNDALDLDLEDMQNNLQQFNSAIMGRLFG